MNSVRVYLKKAKAGDIAAFNALLDEYRDFAYSIAFRICRNRDDAEDVVQDAFVRVFKSIGQFRNESAFSTWLYRIVYNESIRILKSNTQLVYSDMHDEEHIDFATIDDALQHLVTAERKQLITDALNQLHRNENLVLTLHYLHGKSIREIHTITNLSTSNIKVMLHRARKKLYSLLAISVPEMRRSI